MPLFHYFRCIHSWRTSRGPATIGVVLLAAAFCSPVPASPTQAVEPAAIRLTVLPTAGITAAEGPRGTGTFDFGEVSLLDTLAITRTFTVRNDGAAPLVVERLKASCGCTSVAAGKAASAAKGVPVATLAAGETMDVTVTVDLTHLAPGPQRKFVFVYAAGNRDPVAACEMKGRLLPSIALSPMPVDFGRVSAGEERSVTVTATFDPRLSSLVDTPLISPNPAVRVSPVSFPVGDSTARGKGKDRELPARSYRVTVAKDAPLGSLLGVLRFPPVSASGNSGPHLAEALESARLTFVGTVVGDITAEPQTLALGIAAGGAGTTRQITLVGKSSAALENLKITCDSPWLTARRSPSPEIPAPQTTAILDIILAAGTPAGTLQASLTVSLANGQRLIIPVNAYVKP